MKIRYFLMPLLAAGVLAAGLGGNYLYAGGDEGRGGYGTERGDDRGGDYEKKDMNGEERGTGEENSYDKERNREEKNRDMRDEKKNREEDKDRGGAGDESFLGRGAFMVAGGGERERGEREGRENERFSAIENQAYRQECSSCHFLYQPGLLPARSWEKIINASEKHFGENLSLDDKTKNELLGFLSANSAEKTDNEWSAKIMKSAGSGTPERITQVPYIVSKHRKIRPEVFKRASIGSFSNCGACHTKAVQGDFEESGVKIPG